MQTLSAQALSSERASVTIFMCTNGAREAQSPSERNRQRTNVPELDWPFTLHQVVVPCVGRLQPEHLLKAFEAGSDATVVLGCADDNCHYHEGSRRCHRRVEYVSRLLDEIGLGSDRLIFAQLPGSAREDLARGESRAQTVGSGAPADLTQRLADLRSYVIDRVAALPADPIHKTMFPETTDCELDDQDESDD